jgi:sporulation protein YlmC with PRC-barrel domain
MYPTLQLLGESRYAFANPYQDVRGWRVCDTSGQDLGHLEDVLIDEPAKKVRFLKVAHGGVMGFGATHSFIPIEAVSTVADGVVTVSATMQQVAGAPRFDPEVVDNQKHFENLYTHYGYAPPWAPTPIVRMEADQEQR